MKDETWTSEEFVPSHEGRVGVLLADGTVPKPVYFDSNSGSGGWDVRHWSVYDGRDHPRRPRAAVLRAECSCGWTGEDRTVDWTAVVDLPFRDSGLQDADRCQEDWDRHIGDVRETTIPLPAELETLLERVTAAIDQLGQDAPLAALKAARTLEIIAQRTAHCPAQHARAQEPALVAAALGLNTDEARKLTTR
ncbi:hypothetical protein [Streptomyces sp. NPDC091259]|uniref:hypothetical protein n=1 Tax=Streptomyces sp. NPDC091259 TaxID=3365976 RepID=UPI003813593E